MDRWKWSSATYRLDEITSRFPLPCVVQVMEGFLSETETESVSAGDIIKIDSEKTLHKVAANFAGTQNKPCSPDSLANDYVYFTREEILVPLSYQGKLKVLPDVQEFTSVNDLRKAWPRYAKVMENFRYCKSDGGMCRIRAGTIIELLGEEDEMVFFGYDHNGRRKNISVPLHTNGRFMSQSDDNEYTLEEALDRYKLPFLVSFTSDDIKRVYTSDLIEGISNMKTITKTLRLNRRVTQKVLVGHYKPLEDVEETEDSRQRTLVVLPLNSSLVREIEVSVAEDVLEEDYVTVFQVFRNTDKDMEIVDGTLYVDLVSDTGMRRLEVLEEKQDYNQGAPPKRTVRNSAFFGKDRPSVPSSAADNIRHHHPAVHSGRRLPPPLPTEPKEGSKMEDYEEVTPETIVHQPKKAWYQKSPPPPVQPNPYTKVKTKDGKKKKHERKKAKKAPDTLPRRPRAPSPPEETAADDNLHQPVAAHSVRQPPHLPIRTPTGLTEAYEDVTPRSTSHLTGSRMEYQNTPIPSLQKNPVTIDFSLSEINFGAAHTSAKHGKKYSNTGRHRPTMPLPDVPGAAGGENALAHYEGIDVDGENMLSRYEGINVGGESMLTQYEGISESSLSLYDQIDNPNGTPTNFSNENNRKNASAQHLNPAAGRHATDSPSSYTINAPGITNAANPFTKPFFKLTLVELELRLTRCGLPGLAEVCRKENMDGSFFEDLTDDFLEGSPFNLDSFQLKKFRRVKDGWVPK